MKTLKPYNPEKNRWGIYTERKACLGEIQCNKALADRITNGLLNDEVRQLARSKTKRK